MTYRITATAEKDIDDIISYFLTENPAIALSFVNSLYASIEMLASNPLLGHKREDLTAEPIRFWPFKWHYLILYTHEIPIKVVRVLSGHRDISSLLGNAGAQFIELV